MIKMVIKLLDVHVLLLRKLFFYLNILLKTFIIKIIRNSKNILFAEPSPYVYYYKGDEVGAKETKYSLSEVKLPSWKCSSTIDEVKK